MDKEKKPSVHIGAGANIQNVQIGDGNQMSASLIQCQFPEPETVDIKKELATLKGLAKSYGTPEVVEDVEIMEQESGSSEPDKDKIGTRLQKVVNHWRTAVIDGATKETVKQVLVAIIGWLGSTWHHLIKHFV